MYQISQDYIEKGIKDHRRRCPIALYMRENVNGSVVVEKGHLYCPVYLNEFSQKRDIYRYKFSESLKTWVRKFDTTQPVSPIALELNDDKLYIKGELD